MVQRPEAPRACGIGTMNLVRPIGMSLDDPVPVVQGPLILLDRRLHRGRRRRVPE
jgi:hypothetical protein